MTELPHTIYIHGFTKYDILQHGIPSKALGLKRRSIAPIDMMRVLDLIENGFTSNTLTHDVLVSVMIVNDATYNADENHPTLPENHAIAYHADMRILSTREIDLGVDEIRMVVDDINRLYTEYASTLKNKVEVSSIRPVPSTMYGESFELVLPTGASRIDQESLPKLMFSKALRSMTISFNTLETLRLMSSNLISKSTVRSLPEIFYIKNSTVSDFTSKKYVELIQNSVFQLESNLDYTSSVQTAEHVIELDIIRSLVTNRSTSFLKTVFESAFDTESLATAGEDHYNHLINLTSFLPFTEIVAFASEFHKMTQVYLPVQSVVHDPKVNALLLSAYYEAFARIALINNKNTSKAINLIIRYPTTAPKSEFVNTMLPALAVLKNRPVRIIFYGTNEDILKDSPFDCKELTE